jgi:hypothetical protein
MHDVEAFHNRLDVVISFHNPESTRNAAVVSVQEFNAVQVRILVHALNCYRSFLEYSVVTNDAAICTGLSTISTPHFSP